MSASHLRRCLIVFFICFLAIESGAGAVQGGSPKKYKESVVAKNGKKMEFEMVLIPGGDFLMGSPDTEGDREADEGPQHRVKLAPFYLCRTETTIELFQAYYEETVTAKKEFVSVLRAKKNAEAPKREDIDAATGPTPVYGDMTMGYSKKHPALGLTWHNAMTFCKWLSKKTGKAYRLPTEAEWEYACRAGSTDVFGFGDDLQDLPDYAWFEENAEDEIHAVGQRKPNAWGLHDMLGNVNEWVFDFYDPQFYATSAQKTPAVNVQGPKIGKVHVARGGAYESPAEELRCAARAFEEDWWRFGDPQIPKSIWWLPELDIIGFRVARSIEVEASGTK